MLRIPVPRLLPITIFAMSALLAVKSVTLVRAAVTPGAGSGPLAAAGETVVPAAHAAVPAAPSGKPGAPGSGLADAVKGPVSVVAPAAAPPVPPQAASPTTPLGTPAAAAPADAPVTDSERALLLDLRRRRQQLDSREAGLVAREAALAAAEKRLTARVDELTALQAKLESLETARKDREEANWRGLVKLYENMRPREAAVIFNDLEMAVLLQVVDRMKEAKAAPILAAMQPEKARQLTAQLAQMRLRETSVRG